MDHSALGRPHPHSPDMCKLCPLPPPCLAAPLAPRLASSSSELNLTQPKLSFLLLPLAPLVPCAQMRPHPSLTTSAPEKGDESPLGLGLHMAAPQCPPRVGPPVQARSRYCHETTCQPSGHSQDTETTGPP